MLKKIIPSKVLKVSSLFILGGIFACLLHIGPQPSHHSVDFDDENSVKQVACIDHQVSLSSSPKDHTSVMVIATLPPSSAEITSSIHLGLISYEERDPYDPPSDTPLYIQNSILLV